MKLKLSGKGQSKLKLSGNGNECKPLPSSLYSRKPLNSAVQERSRNSMKILRCSPLMPSAAALNQGLPLVQSSAQPEPFRFCH